MFVDHPVGIDLGTTNSEIALLDPGEKDLIVHADKFGRRVATAGWRAWRVATPTGVTVGSSLPRSCAWMIRITG